jgi:hypothetical protein
VTPVRAEDGRLVAVGVQDQRPAEHSHRSGPAVLIDPCEESERRALIAAERGHQPASRMRRNPGVPARAGTDRLVTLDALRSGVSALWSLGDNSRPYWEHGTCTAKA